MDDRKVRFRWKDYRDGNRQKTMTLDAAEFIRRFLIHVLPDGFHRIRYYGFLGNCTARGNSSAAGSCSGWRKLHRSNPQVTTASGSRR